MSLLYDYGTGMFKIICLSIHDGTGTFKIICLSINWCFTVQCSVRTYITIQIYIAISKIVARPALEPMHLSTYSTISPKIFRETDREQILYLCM